MYQLIWLYQGWVRGTFTVQQFGVLFPKQQECYKTFSSVLYEKKEALFILFKNFHPTILLKILICEACLLCWRDSVAQLNTVVSISQRLGVVLNWLGRNIVIFQVWYSYGSNKCYHVKS